MVIGGRTDGGLSSRTVELVSLDPDGNNPVPKCLKRLADFPVAVEDAAGFTTNTGRHDKNVRWEKKQEENLSQSCAALKCVGKFQITSIVLLVT